MNDYITFKIIGVILIVVTVFLFNIHLTLKGPIKETLHDSVMDLIEYLNTEDKEGPLSHDRNPNQDAALREGGKVPVFPPDDSLQPKSKRNPPHELQPRRLHKSDARTVPPELKYPITLPNATEPEEITEADPATIPDFDQQPLPMEDYLDLEIWSE